MGARNDQRNRERDLAFLEQVRTARREELERLLRNHQNGEQDAWKRVAVQRALRKRIAATATAVITYGWGGDTVTFHGRRNMRTGVLTPPTDADFERLARANIARSGDHATWARGLTEPVRWQAGES